MSIKTSPSKPFSNGMSYEFSPFVTYNSKVYNDAKFALSCNNNGLEFMTFIQSTECASHVLPTRAMLNYQAATSLAYGAKGLLYFTYAQVIHDQNNECFGPAVIDKDGNKTHVYNDITEINNKIHKNGKLFLELKHRGVVFFSKDFEKFSTIQPDFKIDTDEILVGVFDYDGKTYLYPVNLSLTKEKEFSLSRRGRTVRVKLGAGEGELIEI